MTYEARGEDRRCEEVAALLAALSHPVRLRIVCGLLGGECGVTPMVDCLGLPQALVSQHLAVLRDAGIVAAVPRGRSRIYRVVHPEVATVVQALRMPSESFSAAGGAK